MLAAGAKDPYRHHGSDCRSVLSNAKCGAPGFAGLTYFNVFNDT